ncbi:MAG: hypothetical protein HKP58_08460 [Desulfatitalea sp.]|nr:hypothetical protein [Desulfatitalea sp.]NNK00433.1 hypothetical protein [Desulfatitalea sp.]
MFEWWYDLESLTKINNWMQLLTMVSAALTTLSIMLLWVKGNRMTRYLIDREQNANSKIKAVEKAAEQIRKELLATQQNQDIANQRRRLAEMDAGALRKEMEMTRKRYSDAEGALKDRIDELKDMNITQTQGGSGSQTSGTQPKPAGLDAQQKKMLLKLLNSGPKGELDIISVLEDPESHDLALEIKQVFDSQGWSTSEIIQSAFSNPPEGLTLVIHSKPTAPSYAKFLQRAFTTIGMRVSAQVNNKYREWSISLIIGQTK